MKKCSKCRNRRFSNWGETETCMGYEMAATEKEQEETAAKCRRYEEGDPGICGERDSHYVRSASSGDYGPSAPWNAPGMGLRDF